ncbi:MAG: 16S rRNA (cytosine(1402)-N(4))-methyltransferase RsmH [Rhodospirillales bacterium]|jgi:16S rRNA (cytosine1402-N4)-methyltransferase|nr:16S rRNA (cytosine(1402)-N(4))-methyltransferase RsmH [Rhodospirillales bacterium]MDP6773197.1 16S rRNA (cytosine(1402)-N(4))-methyltransferase RsmH [Rhodospirillales bacterium]
MADVHAPVMLREVLDILAPRDGGVYVDGTFGAGGYSKGLLEAASCTVWGIDRDPAAARSADLGRRYEGRLAVLCGCYGDMVRLLGDVDVDRVDGVALDLGVSSMQLDDPARGFSFRADGPLDMRMSKDGMTAADVVNGLDEKELADIIYRYGEERVARRIARAIVDARSRAPMTRTAQLADLLRRVVPRSRDGLDPATRTFQALRIYVNDELGELQRGLSAAEVLLRPGGKLVVVSFHSLEDRMVKDFLRERGGAGPRPSRHQPFSGEAASTPSFRLVKRRVAKPTAREVAANPRARSARLRTAERTAAPPWPAPPGPAARRRAA